MRFNTRSDIVRGTLLPGFLAFAASVVFPSTFEAQEQKDVWASLRVLVGEREGVGDGKWGESRVTRRYEFVLDGWFLQGSNSSAYEPQGKNPSGELHRNEDFFEAFYLASPGKDFQLYLTNKFARAK